MPNTSTLTNSAVVIRPAGSGDDNALARLAVLDSAPALRGHVLLAELDGELVAALETATGRSIADPFKPTRDLVALLDMRAARLRGRPQRTPRGPGLLRRTRHALAARP